MTASSNGERLPGGFDARRSRRIAIIGGGSAFIPGVFRGLVHRAEDLRGSEVVLYDVSGEHLDIMLTLGRHMLAAAGASISVAADRNLRSAVADADCIFTTFRPGGYEARYLDEALPLRYGLVGQETAGPGGFFMACRSVPVLLEVARIRDELAPQAWIFNYTNPTSIVTAAIERFSSGRIIGMCDQSNVDNDRWQHILRLPEGALEVDWLGLNHATWAQRVRLNGDDISGLVAIRLADLDPQSEGDELFRKLAWIGRLFGLLANSYLQYYYFHDEIRDALQVKSTTRAQDIMARLPHLYEGYAIEAVKAEPNPSTERGGRGKHGDFAVNAMCAVMGDEHRRMIANTTNRGAVTDLPSDAIVEVPCLVSAQGAEPLPMGALPASIRGLTQAIESYERLAAEAAVTGDHDIALRALVTHPFVRSATTAEALLDDGLAAHRQYLPQFNGKS